jgi:hypothetical protein
MFNTKPDYSHKCYALPQPPQPKQQPPIIDKKRKKAVTYDTIKDTVTNQVTYAAYRNK